MTRRKLHTAALALFMAYLVVSVSPAGAATTDELVVGSQHSTTSELSGAQTLENVTVENGEVKLDGASSKVIDSFEDGDLSEYSGDTGSYSVGTSYPTVNGQYSLRASNADTIQSSSGLDTYFEKGETAKVYVRWENTDDYHNAMVQFGVQDSSNYYQVRLADRSTESVRLDKIEGGSGTTIVEDTSLSLSSQTWYEVTIDRKENDEIIITVRNHETGSEVTTLTATDATFATESGIGFRANSPSDYTFDYWNKPTSASKGTYIQNHTVTNASQAAIHFTALNNASATVTVQEWDGSQWRDLAKSTFTSVGNQTLPFDASYEDLRTNVTFKKTGSDPNAAFSDESILFMNHLPDATNPSLSGGEISRYENVTLSAEISDTEFGSAQGESVTVSAFVDGSKIDEKTVSSAGPVSFEAKGLSDGNHSWHVELTDSYGGTSTSTTWDFEVVHKAPSADLSSATPSNGETVTTRDIRFNISVSDADFPVDGDSVTAELFVDGSSVGTDTLSSNGTASVEWTASTGGDHSYYWALADDYGHYVTTSSVDFAVPGTLEIRSETNSSKLIDDAGSAELIFYGESVNERRETSDGTINMTGLPVDEEFVVVVRIDGYHVRRALIDSLTEQNTVYVLNKSENTVAPTLQYSDLTGQYPKDRTKLYVEKAIVSENSSSAEWKVMSGDYIGASGEFPTYLVKDGRYRLVIENQLGDRRVIGTYHPTHSGIVPVEVGRIEFQITGVEIWKQENRVIEVDSDGDDELEKAIRFKFHDPEGKTKNLELEISDENGTVMTKETGSEQLGEYVFTWPIPEDRTSETWTIEWSATREGEEIGGRDRQSAKDLGVSLPGEIGDTLKGLVAAGLVLMLGGIFGAGNSEIGGVVASAGAGVFVLAGWLDVGLGVITLALAIAVAQKFGSGRASI